MPRHKYTFHVCASTLAALALTACADDSTDDAGTASSLDTSGLVDEAITAEQAGYFADGVITPAEYSAAFEEFQACAGRAGESVEVLEVDEATGVIAASASKPYVAAGGALHDSEGNEVAVDNAVNDCYRRHFDRVDVWFQINDPTVLAAQPEQALDDFRRTYAPCLERNGVSVPDDLVAESAEYRELVERGDDLISAGQC